MQHNTQKNQNLDSQTQPTRQSTHQSIQQPTQKSAHLPQLPQRNSKFYLLLNMAALAAFGPFVTDFYLPALPNIENVFETTTSLVQLSITCSLVGLAFGQLLMGPLSDMYGRKKILQISLVLFVLSTIACLFSWDIYSFIGFRLIQGIAGSGGIVISKSIVADLFKGQELARFFAMLGAIQGLAPICAPIFGGFVLKFTDWHGIFSILLGIGLVLCVSIVFFKETLSVEKRLKGRFWESFSFLRILKNKQFVLYSLTQTCAMGIMFSFIASSSFIFQNHFGLSNLEYSFCFAAAAFGITLGASMTPLFKSEKLAFKVGICGVLLLGILACFILNSSTHFLIVILGFAIMLVFLGFILPSSTSLAMSMERQNAGNASAVLGFSFFVFGGIVSPLTGLGEDIFFATSVVVCVCAIGTAMLGFWALRSDRE